MHLALAEFQSQVRSQSAGDHGRNISHGLEEEVSISGEKPIRWRPGKINDEVIAQLVSISGEKPIRWRLGVNGGLPGGLVLFQSQVRSQSAGDVT